MEMAQNCHAKRKEKKRIIIGEIFCRKNDLFQHQKNNKANKQTKRNEMNDIYLLNVFGCLNLIVWHCVCSAMKHSVGCNSINMSAHFAYDLRSLHPISLCLSLCAHIFHSRSACINMCGMRRLDVTSYTAILNYISHSVKLRQCHTFGR